MNPTAAHLQRSLGYSPVGGLELGAISIANAVSDGFERKGKDVPAFVVRK